MNKRLTKAEKREKKKQNTRKMRVSGASVKKLRQLQTNS